MNKVSHHLIFKELYDPANTKLDHLTFTPDLDGRMRAFVLACHNKNLSPRTVDFYINTLGHFLSFCHDRQLVDPAAVTTDHIEEFFSRLKVDHNPGSVHAYYRAMKRFFHWLVIRRAIKAEDNPMLGIETPARPRVVIIPYREDHISRMLTCCDLKTFHGARNAAIIWVFMDTGLRVSEMVGMRLSDVDVKSRTVTVIGKGNKQRTVRMGQRALQAVLRYHEVRQGLKVGGEALWVNRSGQTLTRSGFWQMIDDLCRRAEISGVRCSPHTFRHFFGTQALRNGAQAWQVQKLMGHETMNTTQIYQRTITADDAIPGHDKFSPGDRLRL